MRNQHLQNQKPYFGIFVPSVLSITNILSLNENFIAVIPKAGYSLCKFPENSKESDTICRVMEETRNETVSAAKPDNTLEMINAGQFSVV